MLTKKCQNCGSDFNVYKGRYEIAKFCSKKCSNGYRKGKKLSEDVIKNMRGKIPHNKGVKSGFVPSSAFKKGHIPANKGKKGIYTASEETRKKISKANKGKNTWSKGQKQSEETINKKRKLTGEKAGGWKGGIEKLTGLIRKNYLYRQWRSDVFTRDNFTCHECGDSKGGNLHAHHIKYLHYIINKNKITNIDEAILCEELWDINNGITLCKTCHKEFHDKNGRIYEEK